MPLELAPIPYNAVPRPVLNDLLRRLTGYSVALARMTGDDVATFELLGSGTLVRRGTRFGILTAHHVLFQNKRPVILGPLGTDRIFLITQQIRTVEIAARDLDAIPLARPECEEFGPDLAFVQFRSGALFAAMDAKCDYWPLNESPEPVLEMFGRDRTCIVHTGYPECLQKIERNTPHVHINAQLYGGTGGLLQGDITQRGKWDFISTQCNYEAFPQILRRFGGMSGGGIWSVLFKTDADGQRRVHDFALTGVTFYQAYPEAEMPLLRGHFARSIYDVAWRGL